MHYHQQQRIARSGFGPVGQGLVEPLYTWLRRLVYGRRRVVC